MRQKQDKSARHRVSCGSVLRVRFTQSFGVKSRYLAGMKLTVFYDYSRHGPVVEKALRSIASRPPRPRHGSSHCSPSLGPAHHVPRRCLYRLPFGSGPRDTGRAAPPPPAPGPAQHSAQAHACGPRSGSVHRRRCGAVGRRAHAMQTRWLSCLGGSPGRGSVWERGLCRDAIRIGAWAKSRPRGGAAAGRGLEPGARAHRRRGAASAGRGLGKEQA